MIFQVVLSAQDSSMENVIETGIKFVMKNGADTAMFVV